VRPLSIDEVKQRATFIVISRLVLVGGVVGALFVGVFFGQSIMRPSALWDMARLMVAALLPTSWLALEALRRAVRATHPARAAFGYTMIASCLNAPLCLVVSTLPDMVYRQSLHFGDLVAMIAAALIYGLVFTIPLGLVYGGAHYVILRDLTRELSVPSQRAIGLARTLAMSAELVGLTIVAAMWTRSEVAAPLCLVVLQLLGFVLVVDATRWAWERFRRARWLAALRSDRLRGYRLVPQAESSVPAHLAPLEPTDESALAVVVAAAPGAPYRDRPEALMLVPRA